MKFTEYVGGIREAIRANFGCGSVHLATEKVHLKHKGETVWDGAVEVFALLDCPKANTGYGWGFVRGDGGMEYVTVLKMPPVDSAQRAVQAYIVSGK